MFYSSRTKLENMSAEFSQQQQPEPLWTTREKEKFWEIVEPYVLQLLTEEIPLPPHNIDFGCMCPENKDSELFCQRLLRNEMWYGKYSTAVANFKAMQQFFQVDASCKKYDAAVDLKVLKQLFMEKSLARSNVKWIEKHTKSFENTEDLSSSSPREESYPSR